MCLYAHNLEPLVAEEDIVCYKVFEEKCGELFSPFVGRKYEINKHYLDKTPFDGTMYDGTLRMASGVVHSLSDLCDAQRYRRGLYFSNFGRCKSYCICKCIIPKGAKYYKGKCYLGRDTFYGALGSEEIKVIEKI